MAVINIIKAEFLKSSNTSAFWLTIGGAAFIPAISVVKCLGRQDVFLKRMEAHPWDIYLTDNWQIAAGFFLTMYVILITSLVVQIEYRNNTWKQIYTAPVSSGSIYFSKLLFLNGLIVLCFLLFTCFLFASAGIIQLIQPAYGFTFSEIPYARSLDTTLKMYASVLGMLGIQYAVSLHIRNFIAPISLGLVLFTAGFMIRQWEGIAYYPYMYPFLAYFPNPGLPPATAAKSLTHSFQWFGLSVATGFLVLINRREKG